MNIEKEKIQNISIIILIISIILFLVVDFIGEKITNKIFFYILNSFYKFLTF